MRKLGFILSGVGGLILLVSFGKDTAPDDTYNIGLLQEQMMIFSFGALLLLVGAVVGAVGHALTRMEEAGILPPAGITQPYRSTPK